MSTAGAVQSTGGGAPQSTGGAPQSTGGSQSTGGAEFAWADGWRDRMAAGSTDVEKDRKQLERYESPEQIWKKARELERRMSSGELRTTLKPGATAQEVAAWRKENGVPEKPEDYKVNMPEGREAPKEDDAFLKSFLKTAHEGNYTQSQVDATIKIFYAEVDRQEKAMGEAEKVATDAADEKLRQEWGADYKTNKAMAEALLARAPAGFRDRFMNGYLADHMPIKASPEAWKWLVQMEREINPAATVVPGAGGDLGKTIDTELAEIRAFRKKNSAAYFKDEKMQARYRDLLTAKEKLEAKAGVKAA